MRKLLLPALPTLRRVILLLLLLLPLQLLHAQLPFTEKQYAWRVETDLEYGTAVNYAGLTETLTLDLYKPVGDDNIARPLLVLVHGGAWLTGCKTDMAGLAIEMAQRGYAVASVNYRKGWHKSGGSVNPGVFLPDLNCLYPADSLEIYRAIYRGMQDVKGAIRWLKARTVLDSTCNQSVLVGGASAGAFLALATGFLDRSIEKPAACGALPDAPAPASNMVNCYDHECIRQTIALQPGALQRPDLGPVEGTMNNNGYSADVIGVLSEFGGMPYDALTKNWLEGPSQPAVYLYHQTCDGVVPFVQGQPFFVISNYCNLGATPWHPKLPIVFGNGALAAYFGAIPNPPVFTTEFDNCDPFNPAISGFECVRYSQNGSYHFVANSVLHAQKVADFFSPVVSASLGSAACLVGTSTPLNSLGIRIAPNPFSGFPKFSCTQPPTGEMRLTLRDLSGKTLWRQTRILSVGINELPVNLPTGIYFLEVSGAEGTGVWKIVCKG